MRSGHWKEIKEVFTVAYDLPVTERSAFLAQYDEDIRHEVEKLLNASDSLGDFIAEPALVELGLADNAATDPYLDKRIDGYNIIRQIGHGGMGTVYLANRADDTVNQQVAIKLIKRGMDTSAVLKRFMMERQILAQLQHANIAMLLDVGTTADGLPYLVMEYVDGKPVTEYCTSRRISTRERLELFRKICSAVSFAHQNLVIHRDIKPSNIVVTDDGTPKLLDFGIAKLLNPDRAFDSTEATATMFRVMTPEYASPEQIRGLPIATTSDVYSLGVILYEMLSGERPYKIAGRLPNEAAQVVLTTEPVKPSSVVSGKWSLGDRKADGIAVRGDPKPEFQNPKLLRGDLDNIVLKSLRKEPERRYSSVQELSEDIRRHLHGLPVTATADSASYRIGKFVNRHRVGVLAGLLIFISLVAGIAATSWQTCQARIERERAERRFKDVRNLANSFLFEFHDAIADLNGATKAREMVVKKAQEYLDSLAQEAGDDRDLLWELSTAYLKLGDAQGRPGFSRTGDTAAALASYEKSLEIRRRLVGIDPGNLEYKLGLSITLSRFGPLYQVLGRPIDAVELMSEATKITDALLPGTQDLTTYQTATRNPAFLGDALAETGNYDEALKMYQKCLSLAQENRGTFPDAAVMHRIVVCRERLGFIYAIKGDLQKSLENQTEFLNIEGELTLLEPLNLDYTRAKATAMDHVGDDYRLLKNYPKAIEFGRRGLDLYYYVLKTDPQNARAKKDVGDCSHHLAESLNASGNFPAALTLLQRTIAIRRELASQDTTNVEYPDDLANSLVLKGEALSRTGDHRGAIEAFQEARALNEAIVAEHPSRIDYRRGLARIYADLGDSLSAPGDRAAAARWFQKALDEWAKLQDKHVLWAADLEKPDEISEKIRKVSLSRTTHKRL